MYATRSARSQQLGVGEGTLHGVPPGIQWLVWQAAACVTHQSYPHSSCQDGDKRKRSRYLAGQEVDELLHSKRGALHIKAGASMQLHLLHGGKSLLLRSRENHVGQSPAFSIG